LTAEGARVQETTFRVRNNSTFPLVIEEHPTFWKEVACGFVGPCRNDRRLHSIRTKVLPGREREHVDKDVSTGTNYFLLPTPLPAVPGDSI